MRKTKIVRFRKGGRRIEKRYWKWKEKRIEEIKKYKYLGYTLKRNRRKEAYVKERVKMAVAIMEKVRGIGKKI